jgi:hypothetical protein
MREAAIRQKAVMLREFGIIFERYYPWVAHYLFHLHQRSVNTKDCGTATHFSKRVLP